MKRLKFSLIILVAVSLVFGLGGTIYAMHSGGVGYCEACHTMHNSLGGATVRKGGTVDVGVAFLLKGSDQSSTCLNCHASSSATPGGITIMTYPPPSGSAPIQRSPGGDFAWIAVVSSSPTGNPQNTRGHNIIASDYGLPAEAPVASMAPGGSYLSSHLYCTSCHNPHSSTRLIGDPSTSTNRVNSITAGAFTTPPPGPITGSGSSAGFGSVALPTPALPLGVYRLLGDVNYVPVSYPGGPAFVNPPPVAVAPSPYNQTEATNEVRVAYGYGMSEWCANCHTAIHTTNATGAASPFIHPAGANALLTATANISGVTSYTYANIYNAYISSGNLTGVMAKAYTSLVPYEEGIGTIMSTLGGHATSTSPIYSTTGPYLGTENVMCLSCHRAHASGFPQATRWYNNYQFITAAGGVWEGATPGSSSNYWTQAEYSAAMYDHAASVFGLTGFQRVLCNKCHAKD